MPGRQTDGSRLAWCCLQKHAVLASQDGVSHCRGMELARVPGPALVGLERHISQHTLCTHRLIAPARERELQALGERDMSTLQIKGVLVTPWASSGENSNSAQPLELISS